MRSLPQAKREHYAIKGPGFWLRHKLRATYTHDGVLIGYRRMVDQRQHIISWYRLNIMDKHQALAMLTRDLITHDRRLTRGTHV